MIVLPLEKLVFKNPLFSFTYLNSNIMAMVRASHFPIGVTVSVSQQSTSIIWCCLVNKV